MRRLGQLAYRASILCITLIMASSGFGCAARKPAQPVAPSPGASSPPPAAQPASSPTPTPWLRGGDVFPNGVTGCWALSSGNVLIESPGKAGQQYSCIVVAEDTVEALTPDSWDCTVKEIRDDSADFIRRNSPSGASPDIVTFSLETLKQTGAKPATDLTVNVTGQPAARPELEPEAPQEGHDPVSRALGKVEASWLLPDGTVLLASREQMFIFRWFPRHNDVCFVAGDAFTATLIDIRSESFDLVCYGWGPTALRVFPYLLTYDLKTSERSKPKPVYLPVTDGVEVGWPKDSREIILSDIKITDNSVGVVAQDAMWQEPAEYHISSDPEKHELVLRMPGTQAKGPVLPLSLANAAGLVRSVRAESGVMVDGDSQPGTTLYVGLDPEKWDRLTYDCTVSGKFTLTIYDDRPPTDISAKVGP